MIQENVVFILGFQLSMSTLIMHSRSQTPAGEASSGAGIRPGGVESCPLPPALPEPLNIPVAKTSSTSLKTRFSLPPGLVPSPPGLFLLCLGDSSFSFQTLLTYERGAFLSMFTSSWFPVSLFYQIVRPGKIESVFYVFLNSILIYIKVFIYIYMSIYACGYILLKVYLYIYTHTHISIYSWSSLFMDSSFANLPRHCLKFICNPKTTSNTAFAVISDMLREQKILNLPMHMFLAKIKVGSTFTFIFYLFVSALIL